jgi:predicted Holliday junction resolvase-like endonuclease
MNFISTFQSFRTVLCICPKCNQIHRLSDLHLKYSGKAPKTWLDTIEAKNNTLELKEEKFEEKESKMREAAVERGRKKVGSVIQKLMTPGIASFKFNPYDIKLITHPIDYIVFDGMNNDDLKEIILLSKSVNSSDLGSLRSQIKRVVNEKKFEWRIARLVEGKIEFE